jgi:hypothetical protein
MSKLLQYGGIVASIVLIAFGAGSLFMGVQGRAEVRDNLKREQIVGTPDMAKSVANKEVVTGAQAKAFATGMRKHTLEATGGQTYAQMARYIDESGKPTNDEKLAAVDPKTQKPVANPARQIWVTETALTTALNTAYFAESVSLFAIVMGFALLLVGVGFLVLTLIALRRPATASESARLPPDGRRRHGRSARPAGDPLRRSRAPPRAGRSAPPRPALACRRRGPRRAGFT